jgi:phage-related protein (TIGR01555 family)
VKITQGAMTISQTALMDARSRVSGAPIRIQPPKLPPGMDSPDNAVAMDSLAYDYASTTIAGQDGINYLYFVGYPYLAMLSQRAEYRAMSGRLASEMTREWIALRSTETAGDETKARMAELDTFLKELKLQAAVQELVVQDAAFGRGNLFIEIAGQDNDKPLIQSPKTIAKGSLKRISTVEPMWTTPMAYNSTDPLAGGFYKASMWNVFGKSVHPTRMMTVVTRPMPDMLKPAYNFSGMSLYQMAEPYVNNWLRTRQSVSDLINTFSTTAIQTDLSQVLTGGSAAAMNARADLFSATKSNRGVMLLDKEREDLVQINTPLGGLHELQAQAQEQMCAVSFMPAIILTGISPGGLNASSDSEIMVWHEWIRGQQEAHYREPIQAVINVAMLSLFGEIDKDISFEFNPLKQMDAKDRSAMRTTDAQSDQLYVEMGVVSEEEVRETLARDPEGRFQGLDLNITIQRPDNQGTDNSDTAADAEFKESDHPRAENGEFGSGGGAATSAEAAEKLKTLRKKIREMGGFSDTPEGNKLAKEVGEAEKLLDGLRIKEFHSTKNADVGSVKSETQKTEIDKKSEIKQKIIEKFETKHGAGKVKIYPNGSIFANGILLGTLSEFAKEFEPTASEKNEQKMMNTGYGEHD